MGFIELVGVYVNCFLALLTRWLFNGKAISHLFFMALNTFLSNSRLLSEWIPTSCISALWLQLKVYAWKDGIDLELNRWRAGREVFGLEVFLIHKVLGLFEILLPDLRQVSLALQPLIINDGIKPHLENKRHHPREMIMRVHAHEGDSIVRSDVSFLYWNLFIILSWKCMTF